MNKSGDIFNIQHFCVHDGPEIRDTVFFKGCPLRCQWCANPESQELKMQVAYSKNKCIGTEQCGLCIGVCPQKVIIKAKDNKIRIDKAKCIECGKCVDHCCSKALHIFGKRMTIEEVYQQLQRQAGVWRISSNVTLSGGEPLMQSEFAVALLKKLKSIGIHTAIETSGYAPWECLEKVAQYCDMIIADIKIYNRKKHIEYTGVDNEIILKNLQQLRKEMPQKELMIRTPVIPGINDTEEELQQIVNFLKKLLPLYDYELLPYHDFGIVKYEQLFQPYMLRNLTKPDKVYLERLNNEFRKQLGIKYQGGMVSESSSI